MAVLSCSMATKRIENWVCEEAEIAEGQELLLLLTVAMINDIFTHLWKLMWCRELGELWTVKTYKTHFFFETSGAAEWNRNDIEKCFLCETKGNFTVTKINHQRVIYHSVETFGLWWLFFVSHTIRRRELEVRNIFHSCSFCTHHHFLVHSPGIVCRLGEQNW